jgi:hypothetical protein
MESHETTTSRDASQYDSITSDVPTNHREPYDDTESVEEVVDEDSIPDIFKSEKKTRFSHIWLPENGQDSDFLSKNSHLYTACRLQR